MTERLATVRARFRSELAAAGVPSPQADTDAIMASVLQVPRSRLALSPAADDDQLREMAELVQRRARREPLQHIIGGAAFRHLWLAVGPGVFVPRPETETLVQVALDFLTEQSGGATTGEPVVAVDLCAGSGAAGLALATENPNSRVTAVELDSAALAWLQRNAAALEGALAAVGSEFTIVAGDAAGDPLPALAGMVDVVIANPPYIPTGAVPRDPEVRDYDPTIALYGGPDGMRVVRPLIDVAATLLRPGGLLAIEHGDEQGEAAEPGANVPGLMRTHGGFVKVRDVLDLAGRPRVATGRRS